MYPLPSYMILNLLHGERIRRCDDECEQIALAQPRRPLARSLALTLGRASIALGHRLEHFGQ